MRDRNRLIGATRGVDLILHAAALKQVPACEYNPFEAAQTNIIGAENVVAAAIANEVPRTLLLSTDKAVNPVNLYGATKLCAEKIVTQANALAADSLARFASVRYGNVVGSRGSVIPIFLAQADTGRITITDERMTRFWITLPQAVHFVLSRLALMEGGEVFVPKIPSMRVSEIAEAVAPDAERVDHRHPPRREAERGAAHRGRVASRPRVEDCYVIHPEFPLWREDPYLQGLRSPTAFATAATPILFSSPPRSCGRCCRRCRLRSSPAAATSSPMVARRSTEADIAAVTSALADPFLTQGPRVEAFERAFCRVPRRPPCGCLRQRNRRAARRGPRGRPRPRR